MDIKNKIVFSSWKLPELFFIGGFLLYMAILYPGFMCYDSVTQIVEAREGIFSDWHPPLMAIIWRVTDKVIPGSAGMLFLQVGILWIGAYLVYHAYFKPYKMRGSALLICLLLFLPTSIGIAGAIIKDVFMWGILLVAFGIAGHIHTHSYQALRCKLVLIVATLLCLWIAMLFRHNALFATIPIIGFVIFRAFSSNSLIGLVRATMAGGIISVVLFLAAGQANHLLSDRHTQPWVANATFDISGVIVRLRDKREQQITFTKLSNSLNSTGTLETLIKDYSPIYWRDLFENTPTSLHFPRNSVGFEKLSVSNTDDLQSLWIHTIYEHPFLWLSHRMAVSKYLLGLAPDGAWTPFMMKKEFPVDLEAFYTRPKVSGMQNKIEFFFECLTGSWVFQPWLYFLVSIGIFTIVTIRFNAGHIIHAEVICILSSAIFHEAGLIFTAPSPDFRYSHYMIFCTLLGGLLISNRSKYF